MQSNEDEEKNNPPEITGELMKMPYELVDAAEKEDIDPAVLARAVEDLQRRGLIVVNRPGAVTINHMMEMDGRNPVTGRQKPKFQRCGNCLERIPMTGDPIEDHHSAMKHARDECPKRAGVIAQQDAWTRGEDVNAQQAMEGFTERFLAAQKPATRNYVPPAAAPEAHPRKPWYKFW